MTEAETQERYALLQSANIPCLSLPHYPPPSLSTYVYTSSTDLSAHEKCLECIPVRSHMSGIRLISDKRVI